MTGDAATIRKGGGLQERVRHVALRARSLIRLHGASWFLTTVALTALGLGSLDYLIRFEDPGIRVICSILLWLVVAWSGYRFAVPAWRYVCTDLHAAQRIERGVPGLGNLLSSAVAFRAQACADDTAGSWELRQAVIAQADAAVAPLDCSACLDRRGARRALSLAGMVLGAIVILSVWQGPVVVLATQRLLVPWGDDPWPRRHVLVITTAPTRLAAGQDFEVALADENGRLPDEVQIHYWFDGDERSAVDTQIMQPLGDKLTHRLTSVTRGFRFRATGGDDQQMAWQDVAVVEPVRVVTQELLLTPPAYTGLAARPATGSFRALEGTRVTLHVGVSRPLAAASLEIKTTAGDDSLPLRVDDDGLGATLGLADPVLWEIRSSGSYGFRFHDREGLVSGDSERWEVEAMIDTPPVVSIRQPTADLLLTARATLTLEAAVKDDLAIRSIALHFSPASTAEDAERVVVLWQGPAEATREAEQPAGLNDDGVQRAVTYDWDLSQIPELQPGTQLNYRVVATDYRPQEEASSVRRVTILSADEHEERLVQRQADILTQVAEVARMQDQNRGQTAHLATTLQADGTLGRADVDQLQGAELNQRQVQQRVGHPADGLHAQVEDLLYDLERNRFDNPLVLEQLSQLEEGLRSLNEGPLPGIERQLISALKQAREALPATDSGSAAERVPVDMALVQSLGEVTADQAEIVRVLEQLLGQLSHWDSYRRLAKEVGRLRREQEELRQQTEAMRSETLSKDVRELSAGQQEALVRLAERQQGVARRFEAWSDRLQGTRAQLAEDDAPSTAALVAAQDLLEKSGVGRGMRDAARDVETNRMGQAAERQDETIRQLTQLQDLLAQSRRRPRPGVAERLPALAAVVAEVVARQQRLEQETRQLDQIRLGSEPEPLGEWRETLSRLASDQSVVSQDLEGLPREYADIETLAMALRDAAAAAAAAATGLHQQETGAMTWMWQQQTSDTLGRILEVLQDETPTGGPDEDREPTTDESPTDEPPPEDPNLLMQLKLVRVLQQELNRQTQVLGQAVADVQAWNAGRVAQQQELARRQGELADVLAELGEPALDPGQPGADPPPSPAREDAAAAANTKPGTAARAGERSLDQQLLDDLSSSPHDPSAQQATRSGIELVPDRGTIGSEAAPAHPLQPITTQMRDVEQQLARREVAEPTQLVQRGIVNALGTLIDELAARQPEPSEQQAASDRDGNQEETDREGQQPGQNATSPSPNGPPSAEHTADARRAVRDMWGHLPERYRRQVQGVEAVEFLPQYRTLIEDYYRRLSENRDNRP